MMQFISLMLARVTAARDEDRGATMVEYGLMVAVIAIVAMVGAGLLGADLNTFFTDIGASLPAVP
ncbi:MAG TPA: Flp family type IVb pilin [Jiangellaceae bacterium]